MAKYILLTAVISTTALAKVTSSVLRALEIESQAEVVVEFDGIGKPLARAAKTARAITTRGGQIEFVSNILTKHAVNSHKRAREILVLDDLNATFTHINNAIYVPHATSDVIAELAKLDGVTRIRTPVTITIPAIDLNQAMVESSTGNEWGVESVQAPSLWAAGNDGQGVVVGSIDSGVRGTHEALRQNWRAEYGWFDPGMKTMTPNDDSGHGTHTMGTIVGRNGIGVAPGSNWIACKGCSTAMCTEVSLMLCAQWMLCPTTPDGLNPRCSLAPHVINNSWGGSVSGESWFKASVEAWRAANIIPVFAGGNSGTTCASVKSPADYVNVIGVGAVKSNEDVTSFSSRGPVLGGRIKPDIVAPGEQVRSTWNTDDSAYTTISGTSMAAPHVTGAIALILAAKPGSSYDDVYSALTSTADTKQFKSSNEVCGGISDTAFPNNKHGYGRVNAWSAAKSLVASTTIPSQLPTKVPTTPTETPKKSPSTAPSFTPSNAPTNVPTNAPIGTPSSMPVDSCSDCLGCKYDGFCFDVTGVICQRVSGCWCGNPWFEQSMSVHLAQGIPLV